MHIYIYIYLLFVCFLFFSHACRIKGGHPGWTMPTTALAEPLYTRSPSQDFRLFGPRPWKILATTYEKQRFLSNPDPGENLVSGNLVLETGCTQSPYRGYTGGAEPLYTKSYGRLPKFDRFCWAETLAH